MQNFKNVLEGLLVVLRLLRHGLFCGTARKLHTETHTPLTSLHLMLPHDSGALGPPTSCTQKHTLRSLHLICHVIQGLRKTHKTSSMPHLSGDSSFLKGFYLKEWEVGEGGTVAEGNILFW